MKPSEATRFVLPLVLAVAATGCSSHTFKLDKSLADKSPPEKQKPFTNQASKTNQLEANQSSIPDEDVQAIIKFAQEYAKWETNKDSSRPIQYDFPRLEKVAAQFCDWKDENKLPGIRQGEHGEMKIFPLWDEQLRTELLNEPMRADIANCRDAYLAIVKVQERTFYYLAYSTATNITLVSSYEIFKDGTTKLEPPKGVGQNTDN